MILAYPIIPAHPFKSSIFREEINRDAQTISKSMLDDFERTTATWEHKVKFVLSVKTKGIMGVAISITTKDKIYNLVDQGTKGHWIVAHTQHGLIFKVGGEPKTEPDIVLSTSGKEGDEWRRKKKVWHPGTRARNFSKNIRDSYKKEFRQQMKSALRRAVRRLNAQNKSQTKTK